MSYGLKKAENQLYTYADLTSAKKIEQVIRTLYTAVCIVKNKAIA